MAQAKVLANHLTPLALKSELQQGVIRPIYLFAGTLNSLIIASTKMVKDAIAKTDSSFEQCVYVVSEHDSSLPDKIFAELKTPPFFAEKKLVICKNDSGSSWLKAMKQEKDIKASLVHIINEIPQHACVVLCDVKLDKTANKAILEAIVAKGGAIMVASEIDETKIRSVIQNRLAKNGLRINPEAIAELIGRNECKWDLIENELQKITLYALGKKCELVDLQMIDLLCDGGFAEKVFDLGRLLLNRQNERAFELLNHLLHLGTNSTLLFVLLSNQLRYLLLAKMAESQRDYADPFTNLAPYAKQKNLEQAWKLSLPWLQRIINTAAEIDFKIKTGQIDHKLGLELLMVGMTKR